VGIGGVGDDAASLEHLRGHVQQPLGRILSVHMDQHLCFPSTGGSAPLQNVAFS
jgi:hypothetical protein